MANASVSTYNADKYLATSIVDLRDQMHSLFPREGATGHFKDSTEAFNLLFSSKSMDYDDNEVFVGKNEEVLSARHKGFKVRDPELFKQYKVQMADYADRMDKEIDDFAKNHGEAGQTLAAIAKGRSSVILKNALNGWPSQRVNSEINLYQFLENLPDTTNLTEETIADIENSKEEYPVYQALASGYEAIQTTIDCLDAGAKGTLTAEAENEYRAKLYKQLKDTKQSLDVIKDTVPGTEAFEKKQGILSDGIKDFPYGARKGIGNLYADVEARFMGIENGWPIEDLNSLSMFNIARHNLITSVNYVDNGIPREGTGIIATPYEKERHEYMERMDAMYEKLQTTPVIDAARRQELLGEMSELVRRGVRRGLITGKAFEKAADRLEKQKNVKLPAAVNEKLGIGVDGKLLSEKNERLNQYYTVKQLYGNMIFIAKDGFLSKEESDFHNQQFFSYYEHCESGDPDIDKFDHWSDEHKMVFVGVETMQVSGLPQSGVDEDGKPFNAVQEGKEYVKWMHDRWQEQADKISEPKYAKIREYFELNAAVNDPDGNYLGAVHNAPYMFRLMSQTTGVPYFTSMPMDQVIDVLNQDKANPLFDTYMDIVTSGLREYKVELSRQQAELRGFTAEDEKNYLRELKEEHEKTIAAYDKIWNTDDRGQYDDYIGNKLCKVCGKNSSTERDISFAVGQLRAEVKAIENGWSSKDLHLFGFIGGLDQEILRYKEQLKLEEDRLFKEIDNAAKENNKAELETLKSTMTDVATRKAELTTFITDFNAMKAGVWDTRVNSNLDKVHIMQQFQALVEKYPDIGPVESFKSDKRVYDELMNKLSRAAAPEVYLQLKDCAASKDYGKLTQMLTQIEAGELMPNQSQEIREVMQRFFSELAAPGPDGLIPPQNVEILENIASQAGLDLTASLIEKADDLEKMEEKVRNGQVPGTETLLGYRYGTFYDNNEMIRDIVNNYVDQTSEAAKKEHAIRGMMERMHATLQAGSRNGQPLFQSGEEKISAIDRIDKIIKEGMSFENYCANIDTTIIDKKFQTKIARASEKPADIGKYGFEIDPNAKEGENIFSKMPEDVRKVREAKSAQDIEANYDAALKDSTLVAAYQIAVTDAAAEAQAELERLEKMAQKTNSEEYKQMHDKLKAVADLRKGDVLDKLTPADVEKAFEDLREAGGTYELSHRGLFKGNIGVGRQRFNFSHDIQDFARDKLESIRRNEKVIEHDRQIGQQDRERKDAMRRSRNAVDALEGQVKEVGLGGLENKFGGSAGRPKIDYAALRAKLHKMQGQQKQTSKQQSMAV